MTIDLVEVKQDRDKIMENIKNIEVLDKVKNILTLNKSGLITEKMASEYFEVPLSTLHDCITVNKKELEENGLKVFKKKEIEEILKTDNTFLEKIPNRGMRLITKRVLLNIAMLLRDSKIAKAVRKRLLDIIQDSEENKGSINTIIEEIDEEKRLSMELGIALVNGDIERVMRLNAEIFDLKNKRIKELEISNQQLEATLEDIVDTNTKYETLRRELVSNIKSISSVLYNNDFKRTYGEFYKFLFDNGYNLELRKTNRKKNIINEMDDLDIERFEIQEKIKMKKEEISVNKRGSFEYNNKKEEIKELENILKNIKKKYRELRGQFNHYEGKKCSKLEFIEEHEYEDIILITRAWSCKNGYDWREGLNSKDETLPFN